MDPAFAASWKAHLAANAKRAAAGHTTFPSHITRWLLEEPRQSAFAAADVGETADQRVEGWPLSYLNARGNESEAVEEADEGGEQNGDDGDDVASVQCCGG